MGSSIAGSDEQPENATLPIDVTLPRIVTFVRLEQYANAENGIRVTPLPIVTLSRKSQLAKQPSEISATLSGMTMCLRFVQPRKADSR